MLALTVTGGAALSWLAASIQYKYTAYLNATVTYKLTQLAPYKWGIDKSTMKVVDFDKVANKMAADMSKDMERGGCGPTSHGHD
jgi:hypothetical protein